jgi:hypothetical protein
MDQSEFKTTNKDFDPDDDFMWNIVSIILICNN